MKLENLIRELIKEEIEKLVEGDVIDAKGRFQQKRKNDLSDKIGEISGSFSDELENLKVNEQDINDCLTGLLINADEELGGKKRLRLRLAPMFTQLDPETSVLEAIWLADEPIEIETARKFVKQNQEKIRQIIHNIKQEMKAIEKESDKKEWLAPWRRYTKWNYFQRLIGDIERTVEDFIKS
jgi:hypothetical protein